MCIMFLRFERGPTTLTDRALSRALLHTVTPAALQRHLYSKVIQISEVYWTDLDNVQKDF